MNTNLSFIRVCQILFRLNVHYYQYVFLLGIRSNIIYEYTSYNFVFFLQGTYTLNNYIPQANKLPANLPFNKMMFEITFVAGQLQIVQFQAYVLFDRDVMIREQFS